MRTFLCRDCRKESKLKVMSVTDVSLTNFLEIKILKANRWLFFWLAVILFSFALSIVEEALNPKKPLYQIVGFLRLAFLQTASMGLGITVMALVGRFFLPKITQSALNIAFFKGFLILLIALAICEALLRIVFHDGMTFSFTPRGPIAEKFKSQLTINRFGSRGPDGVNASTADVRIMVVGDSITFGQGIRRERDLYTTRLLNLLNGAGDARFDMSVLGIPGHEIDDHIRKLDRLGLEIRPDVIIYQWFTNDMELNKSRREKQWWSVWRKLFFHSLLYRYSYAWFFIDNRLTNLFFLLEDRSGKTYPSYILSTFGSKDRPEWQHFESLFREWCEKATRLSPHVMILLYPSLSRLPSEGYQFREIHERVMEIAREYGIKTVDFIDHVNDLSDLKLARVNRFDVHPSAMMHERMAQVLSQKIRAEWPDLFAGEGSEVYKN